MPTANSFDNQVLAANVTFNGGTFDVGTDATSGAINIGTGAASRTTTIGNASGASVLALKYGTGDFTLASATGIVISALDTGEITMPLQSAFLGVLETQDNNVTGDGTTYVLGTNTALVEKFDQNGDFTTAGIYTCPITAKVYLESNFVCLGMNGAAATAGTIIFTSNRTFSASNYANVTASYRPFPIKMGVLCDMDIGDTANARISCGAAGGLVVDLDGNLKKTYFCGNIVC